MRQQGRMFGMLLTFAVVFVLISCARMGAPPGGPPDLVAPKLLGTFPDTVTVLPNFKGYVEFRFDEVIEEGGQSGQPNFGLATAPGGLERLVLLSPDTLMPTVLWKRNRILVRPKRGWAPNTVYRIELLAGLRDLRGNVDKSDVSVTFSTGGERPTHYISGRAIDWTARRAVPNALIRLFHQPENAMYRAIADSLGRFRVGPLPSGQYLVEAVLDNNHDQRRNVNESWDSVRIAATRDSTGEIWMFPRDTNKPKVSKLDRVDSLTIAFTLSFPVDPSLVIPADSIHVWALIGTKDTFDIHAKGAWPQAMYDSMNPKAPPSDSAAKKPDSSAAGRGRGAAAAVVPAPAPGRGGAAAAAAAAAADPPKENRPPLGSRLIVRPNAVLFDSVKYLVEVRGVRLAGGVTGTINGALPALPKPNTDSIAKAKAKTDSIRKQDSLTKAKADSIKRADSVAKAGGRGGRGGGGGLREFRWP